MSDSNKQWSSQFPTKKKQQIFNVYKLDLASNFSFLFNHNLYICIDIISTDVSL